MPNWKKVIVSGSDASLNSLSVANNITASGVISGSNLYATSDVVAQGYLRSFNSSGDEGGEIFLSKAVTNTSITGGVTIDVYQNRLRFFEQGGTARGYYIDISSGGGAASTNLVGGGGGTPGGSTTQIQYNNGGAFGGVPTLTYDGTTLRATGSFTGSFIGTLTGTASFATSASWAPGGGATFPYTGSAIITGSLVVTGSLTTTDNTYILGSALTLGTTTPFRQLTINNTNQSFLAFQSTNYRTYTLGSDPSGFVIYDDTGGGYRFAIDSSGNVAVGSNAASHRLDVQGGRMRILNTNAGSSPGMWLAGTGTDDVFVGLQGNTSTSAFGVYSGASWQLTILNGGNVGLGTTSPSAKLEVVGNVSASAFTGSLLGTASFATSASQASTASYVLQAVSASFSTTASYALDIHGGFY